MFTRVFPLFMVFAFWALWQTSAPGRQRATVSDEDFSRVVLESNLPVLGEFWASWCSTCRHLDPMLDELEKSPDSAGMTLVRIDIDRSPAAARRYGVSSVPTMFVFRNGQVMGRFSGLPMQDELKQFVAEAREKSQPQPDSSRCASLAGGAPDLALCN